MYLERQVFGLTLQGPERRDGGACRSWVASTPGPDSKRCKIDGVNSVIWPNIILFLIMAVAIVAGIVAVSRAVRRHS
jgi:hypothetical protein